MSNSRFQNPQTTDRNMIEPLEQRIAPAVLTGFQTITQGQLFLQAGTDHAGLSLNGGPANGIGSGSYFLYVEKGSALVFTKDINNNGQIDFNEITGISAGDGLRLISFVDIHGDIVTNLNADGTLTDSDSNASNGLDGKVLLNSKIESIQLRSVTEADLTTDKSDPNANAQLVQDRLALSNYSIFGNIYAGGGFGVAGGGLRIDTVGKTLQDARFTGQDARSVVTTPEIGSIRVGTAVSGQHFSFGISAGNDIRGTISPFVAVAGQAGADIIGVNAASVGTKFNLGTLQAGNGGFGGRGGNVSDVHINGDTAGGYGLIAGNAGAGNTGPTGGSISNFSDTGSVTSEVILQTGNGGQGLLGAGGAAGTISFDPTQQQSIFGRVQIKLGNGGNGFTNGAAGGSLTNGNFTVPESDAALIRAFVTTTHNHGEIGTTTPFDFNGTEDVGAARYNDGVYTTATPGQLVVTFGGLINGGSIGFDPHKNIYLNGPENAQAVAVGDVNGDGHPDIIAASSNENAAGIYTFLSQYDQNGKFTGFTDALISPLPSLFSFNNQQGSFQQKAVPVISLAVGNFDGDVNNVPDIAVMTVQSILVTGAKTDVVLFLKGDPEPGVTTGSGYFFADFTGNTTPFVDLGAVGSAATHAAFVKATAPKTGDTHDVVIAGVAGEKNFAVLTYDANFALKASTVGLGKVDTDRVPNTAGKDDHSSKTDATLLDFTVLDFSGDGNADVVVLTKAPTGFLITYTGDGAPAPAGPTFTESSSGLGGATPPDQNGIKLGSDGGLGIDEAKYVGLLAADVDGDGMINDVAAIGYNANANGPFVHEIVLAPTGQTATLFGDVGFGTAEAGDATIQGYDTYTPQSSVPTQVGYAIGEPYLSTSLDSNLFQLVGDSPISQFENLTQNGFLITAGHGGDALTGAGGAGGHIGTGVLSKTKDANGASTITGSLAIVLPVNVHYDGTVRLLGGAGGDGFTNGGAGGGIAGTSVNYAPGASLLSTKTFLLAGHGGMGLTGVGGNGGDLHALQIQRGEIFLGGAAGIGVVGGKGGAIIGNTIAGSFDVGISSGASITNKNGTANTETSNLLVLAGAGAGGLDQGGAGGGINQFVSTFLPLSAGQGGLLNFQGGAGGDSGGGTGGAGGSILNSSPKTSGNNLAGDIFLEGGRGGRGLSGGGGGSIVTFENNPAGGLPKSLSALGGDGGIGVLGNGGAGGTINGVKASAIGQGSLYTFDFSNPAALQSFGDAVATITPVNYNRLLAGNGGDSFGAAGGAGGAITNSTTAASHTGSASILAGGKGGNGLTAGAAGGSVVGANGNAADLGKVLVVGGEGGTQFGSISTNPADPLQNAIAFGGVNGPAGNGGSITNFHQLSGNNVHVDLIAGNGGDTINHGSKLDDKPSNVGRGGSISTVVVAGDIGNIAPGFDDFGADGMPNTSDAGEGNNTFDAGEPLHPEAAIKSYNAPGQTMANFIATQLRTATLATLDDTTGNVGIVVGASGGVRDNDNDGQLDPASGGINGSLLNVQARNIMSAVAGSVDRIASIQQLANVKVTIGGGVFGADKIIDSFGRTDDGHGNPYTIGLPPDYLSTNSAATGVRISTPTFGSKLVDGAIVAKNADIPFGGRIFPLG